MTMYIYKTTFKDENGESFFYYGKRTLRHTNPQTENYYGSGKKIRELLSIYSPEHFSKEILKTFSGTYEEISSEVENLERKVIAEAFKKDRKHCLNERISSAGTKQSEEAKEKMSSSHLGKTQSEETKEKISQTMKGNHNRYRGSRKALLDFIFSLAKEGEEECL